MKDNSFFIKLIFITLFFPFLTHSQVTIDFNNLPYNDNQNITKTVDIAGFRFTINSPNNDQIQYDTSQNPSGSPALFDNNLNVGDITEWKIEKIDNSKFQLSSIYLQDAGFGSTNGTIAAYRDGVQIGNLVSIDFDGIQTVSNNPDFNNIDEIRIQGADINFFLDDLTYILVTPPTLTSSTPADETTGVSVSRDIVLTFDKDIVFGTGNIEVIDLTDGTNSFIIDAALPGLQASITGSVLTIDPSANIDNNSNYSIRIAATAIDDANAISYAGITDDTTLNFTTVALIPLTVTVAVNNKVYDHTTTATAGSGSLSGAEAGDDVTINGIPSDFNFATANVGTAIIVTATGNYTITGTDAAKYSLSQPTLSADITAKILTITIAANNKVYDNTTKATAGLGSLGGVEAGDDVFVNGMPSAFNFATANVGTAIVVTATGNYTITGTDVGNYTVTQPTFSADITAKPLTITVVANNKVYNNTTKATAGLGSLGGVEAGDDVFVNGVPGDFDFATANVGTAIVVTATGSYSIAGTDIGNYTLTQPTLSADITAKALTITVAANNKVYDNTTRATVGSASLSGTEAGDDVTINAVTGAFNFATANVGTAIVVAATDNYTITGTDVGNYTVTQPTFSADITAKPLTITVVANNKVYNNTTKATAGLGSLGGVEAGDDVFVNGVPGDFDFATANVGTAIVVTATGSYSIAGTDIGNYTLTQPTLSADITAKALTITVAANNKVYDNTTRATVGSASLSGTEAGDDVTINAVTGAFNFATANVGTAIVVAATDNYTITGTDAGNYTVTQPTLSAGITEKELTISGLTGDNKVFDDTTTATATGHPVLNGIIGMDDASLSGIPVLNFIQSEIGTDITINTTGYSIVGTDKGNYSLTQPKLSADITAALGLNDVTLREVISLYPNPIKDVLYFKTNGITIKKISLFNVLGKSIKNIEIKNEKIDFSRINTGIYLLRITTDQGTLVKRVFKE
jgi:hypothetical protein